MTILNRFDSNFAHATLLAARTMIDMGIWSGIERHKFDSWCQQFETDEEKLLLSFILKLLTYRSKEQVRSLLHQAIDKNIPQALFEISGDESIFVKIAELYSYKNLSGEVAIVPVIGETDPPTKSGPLVARLFKRLAKVNESAMKWPWRLDAEHLKIVIFIDDFVGTGNQFLRFFKNHVDEKLLDKNIIFIYCPMTATKSGIENINRELSLIKMAPIEIVTEDDNFFTCTEKEFKLTTTEVEELDEIYLNFLKKNKLHKIGGKKMIKGYGGLALTIAYDHATPNASLPLLWANNDDYSSLFSR